MPTKINAFAATNGEPVQLLESWFGPQLAQTPMGVAADNGGDLHHVPCGLHSGHHSHVHQLNSSLGALSGSVNASDSHRLVHSHRGGSTVLGADATSHHSAGLGASVGSISNMSEHATVAGSASCASGSCRRMSVCHRHQPFVVEGLTFELSDEALAWTLTKRKLLAIIGKADCFVSTRTCPYDVLVGVSVVENPNTKTGADGMGAAAAGTGGGNISAMAARNGNGVGGTVSGSAVGGAVSLEGMSGGDTEGVNGSQNHFTFVGSDASAAAVAMATAPYTRMNTAASVSGDSANGAPPTASAVPPRSETPIDAASTTNNAMTVPHSPIASAASFMPANLATTAHVDPMQSVSSGGGGGSGGTAAIGLPAPSPFAPVHKRSNTASTFVAPPAVEPEYRPWPLSKSTLGELLIQAAEESGVALTDSDDAPKASDAVGFAAAMVAKLCRKAILHNFNKSEAHFTVNLLVLSRPIGNEYAPSHGLYRVPHAPSAVTKERCSSAVVLSVIGKVMEETRALAMAAMAEEKRQKGLLHDGSNGSDSDPTTAQQHDGPNYDNGAAYAPIPPTTSNADRPPLPRAAIGVAERVKHYGPQLLQELEILRLTMIADAEAAGVGPYGTATAVNPSSGAAHGHANNANQQQAGAATQQEREGEEMQLLEVMLQAHFQNSIDVIVQFTGADERDALFALMEGHTSADLESAAARLMEGYTVPPGPIPIEVLRSHSQRFLDQQAVGAALESKLGSCLGALNGVGFSASGAPLTAVHLPLVQCADRLVTMGYTQEEAHRASRGAAGNFDVAAAFLAGDHSVQRMVRQRFEEVMWFTSVVESIRNGTAKAGLVEVTTVVEMVAKDPQAVLYAWHTPSQQAAVKMLSDAFVQAIMQYKQTAMLRMQQQQQQQLHHHGQQYRAGPPSHQPQQQYHQHGSAPPPGYHPNSNGGQPAYGQQAPPMQQHAAAPRPNPSRPTAGGVSSYNPQGHPQQNPQQQQQRYAPPPHGQQYYQPHPQQQQQGGYYPPNNTAAGHHQQQHQGIRY